MSSLREIEIVSVTKEEAIEVYTGKGMEAFLDTISAKVAKFPTDISTDKQRKIVKSNAYRIARLKTTVDNFGKDLVADAKAKVKVVDKQRKIVRDFLEYLQHNYKAELDEAEARELEEVEKEKQKKIDLALEEIKVEREAKEKAEAELAEMKKLIQEKEEAEALEARNKKAEEVRIEREKEIAREAKEKAEKEARDAIIKAKRDLIEAEVEARHISLKAEEDKKKAVADALAEHKAKEEADEKLKKKAIAIEEESKKTETYYKKVNNEVLADLESTGMRKDIAKSLIKSIVTGKIRHVALNY